MYIVELTYTAPIERVDALLAEHVAWLDEQYAAGHLLASGRKDPRDGGVLLATGALSREALDELIESDPFAVGGVAEYRIVSFEASKTAPGLEGLK